jgi:hypothetical protein
MVFGVYLDLVPRDEARTELVLYPHYDTPDAAPQCISGRTS